jgi:hypothetical protein
MASAPSTFWLPSVLAMITVLPDLLGPKFLLRSTSITSLLPLTAVVTFFIVFHLLFFGLLGWVVVSGSYCQTSRQSRHQRNYRLGLPTNQYMHQAIGLIPYRPDNCTYIMLFKQAFTPFKLDIINPGFVSVMRSIQRATIRTLTYPSLSIPVNYSANQYQDKLYQIRY